MKCAYRRSKKTVPKPNTIRLDALRREIRHFPTLVAFARKYGLDSTYLSQLLNGHRNLGEKAARNLEAKLGWVQSAKSLTTFFEIIQKVVRGIEGKATGKGGRAALGRIESA